MIAPPVLLLSRSAISGLATTRDYLAAMQAAFADLARGRFEVPHVGHVPGVGGMSHIKSAQRCGSPSLAAIKVNGNFPGNVRSGSCRPSRGSWRCSTPNVAASWR